MSTVHAGKSARGAAARMPRPPRGRRRGHGAVEDPRHGFSEEEWHDMVSTAAYYRARARGFENGSADEDWFEAEAELRTRFGAAESDVEGGPNPGDGATGIETKGE